MLLETHTHRCGNATRTGNNKVKRGSKIFRSNLRLQNDILEANQYIKC